eukprot:14168439-Ditylum_brightwellii.AAC.1
MEPTATQQFAHIGNNGRNPADEEWRKWKKKVKLVDKDAFSYLDMQLQWRDDELSFAVYHKKNQTIKYVNCKSCHQTAVFKAIPVGVFTHMG